ncbi:MAG: transglycosylase [Betaproteobacteria bacterium]|nr:transglycosylase [Betaproteobacteria bacterium]
MRRPATARASRHAALLLWLLLGACAQLQKPEPAAVAQCPAPAAAPTRLQCPACPVCPPPKPEPPLVKVPVFEAVGFDALPGWSTDNLAAAWGAFRASCHALRFQALWQSACNEAAKLAPGTATPELTAVRAYFESRFVAYRLSTPQGNTQGLATGYYEPLLRGSRTRRAPYLHALYAPPEDLLVIDLISVNPDLRNMRLRGRVEGRRVVPYWSRAEIERGMAPVAGKELVWVDDHVEAFFLEVQGSGRIQLDSGETLRLNYADQNGHPYQSIGRWLLDRGELRPGEATMQGIKAWALANPTRVEELLAQNPSYVFFRELQVSDPSIGPPGAQGVPLTPERSIAVDPRYTPLGAPVFLATTYPNSEARLERLVIAQDTGGAIRGPVRADYFWGFGAEAGALAGRMRQPLRMWVLLPKGFPLPAN